MYRRIPAGRRCSPPFNPLIPQSLSVALLVVFCAACAADSIHRPWATTLTPEVDIVLSAPSSVHVGDTVPITCWAWSDTPTEFAGVQVLLNWSDNLSYTGSEPGEYPWCLDGFVADGLGLNDSLDDGDGIWVGWADWPGVPYPQAPGVLVTWLYEATTPGMATITCDDPLTLVASPGGINITGARDAIEIDVLPQMAAPEPGSVLLLMMMTPLLAVRSRGRGFKGMRAQPRPAGPRNPEP